MTTQLASGERKSAERRAFELYLRYGIVANPAPTEGEEQKFNSRHAADGRFDFASGHGTLPPREGRTNMARVPTFDPPRSSAAPSIKPTTAAQPTSNSRPRSIPQQSIRPKQVDHGALSARHESGGAGDPGAVSSGTNDPGGISYGKHQYSSARGITTRFVASPEAQRWSSDFDGLLPGTPRFSQKWREVAAKNRMAFGAAQDAFTGRTHYDAAVRGVVRSTGLNVAGGSER